MKSKNHIIYRVEHHPLGLALLVDECDSKLNRIVFFLHKPSFHPRKDDVLSISGRSATINTGKTEHNLKLVGANALHEIEPPEVTSGHS